MQLLSTTVAPAWTPEALYFTGF